MSIGLDSSILPEEMSVLLKGFVPENTQKNNACAMWVFSELRAQRNRVISDKAQQCLENFLNDPAACARNFCLLIYRRSEEARWTAYPSRTIHQLYKGK